MTDPGRMLRARGMRPKKALGQHFLRDRSVLARIVALLDPGPSDRVVEIGAGMGALTLALLDAGVEVLAIERDAALCDVLREQTAGRRVTVLQGDARKVDLLAIAGRRGPVLVAGNIPYQISSDLLLRLVDQRASFRAAVLMVQAEFATRVAAAPGGKDYGSLSVRCQQYLDVKRAFRVAPGCFHPPPRVDSTVMRLVPRAAPLAPVADEDELERLVRAAFSKRRKTLRNTLRGRVGLDQALARAAIDGTRRPETLSVAEFARLCDELCRSFPK